jgi:lipid II:glycine glycyltransferase (peptidoglycan interpeptide bridge formation enzyme)
VIEEVKGHQGVHNCYDLLKKTYANARMYLAHRSLFDAAFDVLQSRGMIKILLARVNGYHAASSVELVFKDVIYGWYGGIDRTYSMYIPNELLSWHIFKWGAENGYRVYDFGGAGKPGEKYGVRDFKAKFGGRLTSFGRNICIHSSAMLALSELGYRIYRRLI